MVHHFRGLMVSAKYLVPFSRFSNVPSFGFCFYTVFTGNCECVGGKAVFASALP